MVKKYAFLSKIVFLAALMVSLSAMPGSAALITLSPEYSDIGYGSTVRIDVIVSELGIIEDVGEFDVTIEFDAEILEFVSGSISDNLGSVTGGDAFDASSGEIKPGFANLSGISFLPDLSAQADSFSLGTIVLKGKNFGTSKVALTSSPIVVNPGVDEKTYTNILGDANGDPLDFSIGGPASVHVPEPSSLALLLIGLTGLPFVRMRKRKS